MNRLSDHLLFFRLNINENIHHRSSTTLKTSHCSLPEQRSPMICVQSCRGIVILISGIVTVILCLLIVFTRDSIRENLHDFHRLFQFCLLYENTYYFNLLTLPIACVILLLIFINQLRLNKCLIPLNSFSKINRFDPMILCGLISHEILVILDELIFRVNPINGPLFDLIRQIGLIIIVALRYYPLYVVIEMTERNILYYGLCSFYVWINFLLKLFEQIICTNHNSLIRSWNKSEQMKNKTKDHLSSIFDHFGIHSSMINVLKCLPYYLCLIYICLRLTSLFFSSIYRVFYCCDDQINGKTHSIKHIYHEPTSLLSSIEHNYVHNLFHRNSSPMKYFRYSKQIFNLYMIASLLIYYLTFNVLHEGFYLTPLLFIYDQLDLSESKFIGSY